MSTSVMAGRETAAPMRTGLTVNEIYEQLKQMAVLYKIRPGERFNELELAERFNVSRTPIREALNRLVAENLLVFVPNRGFFIRELEGKDVFDLFELRRSIETTAVTLACERASDNDIKALRRFWKQVMKNAARMPSSELVVKDEQFHLELAALSGNAEIGRVLQGINARIHYVRWVDVDQRRNEAFTEHLEILDALAERDAARCAALTDTHIRWRMEEITRVVQASVVKLYAK
ncbi:GntR family transcriptional regulator [Burkholderia ambifaria]|uniref:GntR family transcriptional regulator n=1 Tax=Burkholderia ambifaria TaxID=152480 RepID=UPI000CFE4F10|nr:GntR family transcriptional regulator [Burkholderia ambifaria]ELK6208763.1 GntR family transcriptional regulator [Burkholderia ambifaria]MBR8343106.1 GntR family transcriptional regulator [Burkholderia ambifaria]NHL68604.1 GntR family transcriptional regulator [Burkholderia ambifaria]PRG07316.1 GntR family transcriptional regulator [Burkholderia ambifaria]QQK00840.1 GntR family transcriptional regulator [Burkholderia ambifaria]